MYMRIPLMPKLQPRVLHIHKPQRYLAYPEGAAKVAQSKVAVPALVVRLAYACRLGVENAHLS